jgi:hypothetical protein
MQQWYIFICGIRADKYFSVLEQLSYDKKAPEIQDAKKIHLTKLELEFFFSKHMYKK